MEPTGTRRNRCSFKFYAIKFYNEEPDTPFASCFTTKIRKNKVNKWKAIPTPLHQIHAATIDCHLDKLISIDRHIATKNLGSNNFIDVVLMVAAAPRRFGEQPVS